MGNKEKPQGQKSKLFGPGLEKGLYASFLHSKDFQIMGMHRALECQRRNEVLQASEEIKNMVALKGPDTTLWSPDDLEEINRASYAALMYDDVKLLNNDARETLWRVVDRIKTERGL